jgi:septal ring factor EnvC (AmiA/AmiB activator)
MSASLHEELHHDHIVWKAELSQWRDDTALWKKEMCQAEVQIKELEKALKSHREALESHAVSVQDRMRQTNKHESAIAAYETGEAGRWQCLTDQCWRCSLRRFPLAAPATSEVARKAVR